MATKRMTANPVKPARYRPGKAVAGGESPEEEEEEEEEQEQQLPSVAPPRSASFPSKATQLAASLKNTELGEVNDRESAEAAHLEAERVAKATEDGGFVTEESGSEEGSESGSESEEGSSSGESSSEEEAPKRLLRPTFIKKGTRKETDATAVVKDEDAMWAEEEKRRKEKADAMIQEQLERDAAARAAGKKDWDDDEIEEIDQVDDTDGLDPETERAAWKLRELKRVKREREAIEKAEKEREEVERRRNLSKEEREAEDQDFLEAQKNAREGKGKMSYMQKYFHKGAFYQDDEVAEALANRDIMGSRIADDVANRDVLPQYMQIRDMTKLGRKGRTKYKDLKSEDTGRWAQELGRGGKEENMDDRFKSDKGRKRSGANAAPLGERKKAPEDATKQPRADSDRVDRYRSNPEPPKEGPEGERRRRRSPSRSRSSLRRREQRRSHSYSRSHSRDRRRGHDSWRKRSPSPHAERYVHDKRRRMETN